MLRRPRSRRRLTASAVVIALGGAAGLPAPAGAAELTPQALPGRTMAAVVVDLDHDGSAELARLVHRDGDTSVVEVWRLADGTWELHGSEAVAPADIGDEVGDPMSTAALLSVDVDGEPVLILHTAVVDAASSFGASCCAAAYHLQLAPDGLELISIEPPAPGADVLYAVDMDADGTDEVVAVHTTYATDSLEPEATTTLSIRRRVDGEWVSAFEQTRSDPNGVSVTPAESDGRPGMDLLVTSPEALRLGRITLSGGAFQEELGAMPRSSADGAWIAGAAGGNLLVSEPTGLSAVRWEAGGVPVLVDRLPPDDGALLAAFGDGDEAIVLVGTGQDTFGAPTSLEIRDGALTLLGHVETSPEARALSELLDELSRSNGLSIEQSLWPFFGHIPGGWIDGRPAFVVGGTLLRTGGSDGFTSQPMATLTSTPVGLLGPDLEWAALCDGCYGGSDMAYPTMGEPWGRAELTLVPTTYIDGPEPVVAPAADYIGAHPVENAEPGASTELRASREGFEIVLGLPPGISAVSFDGRTLVDHVAVETPSELRIEVGPPRGQQSSAEFEHTVVLIGPDTRPAVLRWHGTFLPERPDLAARVDVEALSLSATISGHASPGSTVTVDGTPVEVAADGAFSATVDAPPWPRDVAVAAHDGFGGERVTQVAVIGLVDYRSWPWVAIVGAMVGAGAIRLFLRTPARRERSAAVGPDDGVLEELDGDAA